MIDRRNFLTRSAAGCLATLALRGPARAQIYHASRDGTVRLPDGRCLGYREFGNPTGPVALYFHGVPGTRIEAELIADDVQSSGTRLIAIDRPGLGCSSYQHDRCILDWPCDVGHLLAALGIHDYGVIGVSGGAPYALACCLKLSPHSVALVSGHTPFGVPGVNPGNQDRMITLVARRQRLARVFFRLAGRGLERRPRRVVEMVTNGWTAADRRLILCNPHYYRQFVRNLRATVRCGPRGLAHDVRRLREKWGFQVGAACCPRVSIWQGGCDPIAPPSMGRYFQRNIAGSELILDPCAGHVTMLKRHAAAILASVGPS